VLAHQKNSEGNSIIHEYLRRDYPEPKDFASFLYVSQVLQAEGIKIGAGALSPQPPGDDGRAVSGQLNDCWAGGLVVGDRLLRPLEGAPYYARASMRPCWSRRTWKTAR